MTHWSVRASSCVQRCNAIDLQCISFHAFLLHGDVFKIVMFLKSHTYLITDEVDKRFRLSLKTVDRSIIQFRFS